VSLVPLGTLSGYRIERRRRCRSFSFRPSPRTERALVRRGEYVERSGGTTAYRETLAMSMAGTLKRRHSSCHNR